MVPDSTVAELLPKRLGTLDLSQGFVPDGLPRAEHQLELVEQLLSELELRDYRADNIDIPQSWTRLSHP